MKAILRQFKQIFVIACLLFYSRVSAQHKLQPNRQEKNFYRLTTEANVSFILPEGFKETAPINNDEITYDYGIALPGKDVEIWFAVMPFKYSSKYLQVPDSAYLSIGKTQVSAFSADNNYFVRNLTAKVLSQYNSDHGKSYLLNLNDSPITRHYRYGLILALQKDHVGTVLAVCLANEKGPEFFKSLDKARNCIKFK